MKWKNYRIGYCLLCETMYYACSECGHSSCSGGGCDKCIKDYAAWQEWRCTREFAKKENLLKVIAYLRHVWYVLFKWDKRSRELKSIFGWWRTY